MILPRVTRQSIQLLTLWLIFLVSLVRGGELAAFTEPQMTPNVNHRQNVCDRNQAYLNGNVALKDGLRRMQLNVLLAARDYFFYDPVTGIDDENPGMMALILDELALRAGFTWRDSFAVQTLPTNETWTDLLMWGIESYDVQGDWWARNMERMNMGVHFVEPWYDASLIMMTKEAKEVISDEISFTNWLRPYEPNVWYLTIFTIFLSGVVYQWLEWFQGEEDDRSFWLSWQENFYLSAINFTQAYEYQPTSLSARLFGISMAIWSLVMTATYTANLASMLVDRKVTAVVVESVDQAAVYGFPICVWEGTWADTLIKKQYPAAKVTHKLTEEGCYYGLHDGECVYSTTAYTAYNKYRQIRDTNPSCDLEWVGEPLYFLSEDEAGFAMKVDSGERCTGFIATVLDLHMTEIRQEGVLDHLWEQESKKTQTINCDVYDPSMESDKATPSPTNNPGEQRQLQQLQQEQQQQASFQQRILKSGGKGAAGGAIAAMEGSGIEGQKLTVEQMVGTFLFHWSVMAISVAIACWRVYYNKYFKKRVTIGVKSVGNSVHKTTSELFGGFQTKTQDASGDESFADDDDITPAITKNTTSVGTADTINLSAESKGYMCTIGGSDQEAARNKSLSQEMAEMRQFQLKILDEQQAIQQQLRLLAQSATISRAEVET